MKYRTHIYAKALVEVLGDAAERKVSAKEESRIAENFLALVRRNGDEMHLRKILEEASRFARGMGGVRKVVLESARALTDGQRKEALKFVKKEDVVVEKIDPELVAGVRITVNDELQFDGSLRHKLDHALGNTA